MRPASAHPWSRDPTPGIAVLVAGIAFALFVVMTVSIIAFPAFQGFDERVSARIHAVDIAALETVARALSFIGDRWPMVTLTVLGTAFLLSRRMRAEAVLLASTMVCGALGGRLLKELIERARPGIEFARIPVPESYSFPSAHALAAFLFFGMVAFLFFTHARTPRVKIRAWLFCAFMALGVALARVYLGVHFLGDIIASWMLGSAFLTAFVAAYVWWVTRPEPATPAEESR
jgi:undecaprenyl-diphosphatase